MQSHMNAPPAPASGGTFRRLAVTLALGVVGGVGLAVSIMASPGQTVQIKLPAMTPAPAAASPPAPAPVAATQTAQAHWVAAAPGRVEPRTGQIRISAALPGRVTEIAVKVNDRVAEGEVLIRLEDKEPRARLAAAEAEAAARKRERDAQPATAGREDLRKAEDAVFAAERAVMNARFELDDALSADRKGSGSPQAMAQARKRMAEAKDRLKREHATFAIAAAKGNIPAPNRFEAALIASRTDVALAEEAIDKTRIRATAAGTVLQLNAKRGEMVAPSAEMPLIVVGDMSILRVRAEVDEQDVAKIKLGQRVFVRSNAHPGQDFEGTVTELSPSLATPRMGARGPRRATDVEVMEVMIDLDGKVPLLPGMRADAFFK